MMAEQLSLASIGLLSNYCDIAFCVLINNTGLITTNI